MEDKRDTNTIYVDIDVLFDANGNIDQAVIDWITNKKNNEGYNAYVWSDDGSWHARHKAKAHNIDHLFNEFLARPDTFIVDSLHRKPVWAMHIISTGTIKQMAYEEKESRVKTLTQG